MRDEGGVKARRYEATSFAENERTEAKPCSREITGLTSKRQSSKKRKYNYSKNDKKKVNFLCTGTNRLMEMNPFILLFDLSSLPCLSRLTHFFVE